METNSNAEVLKTSVLATDFPRPQMLMPETMDSWEKLRWFRRGWKDGAIGDISMQDVPSNWEANAAYRMGYDKGREDRGVAAAEALAEFAKKKEVA